MMVESRRWTIHVDNLPGKNMLGPQPVSRVHNKRTRNELTISSIQLRLPSLGHPRQPPNPAPPRRKVNGKHDPPLVHNPNLPHLGKNLRRDPRVALRPRNVRSRHLPRNNGHLIYVLQALRAACPNVFSLSTVWRPWSGLFSAMDWAALIVQV